MEIDEFVLERVFNKIVREDDGQVTYWRETLDEDGYIVFWPDLGHDHTYRYPPDIWA